MDSFQIIDNLHSMNWNELTSIIKKAEEIRSAMENQAIGAMINAQLIMQENHTRRFPDSEREALYRLLRFDGSYKQVNDVMDKFSELDEIKYAVAAFSESISTNAPPSEYKILMKKLYKCNDEPVTQAWKDARERFWNEFEKKST